MDTLKFEINEYTTQTAFNIESCSRRVYGVIKTTSNYRQIDVAVVQFKSFDHSVVIRRNVENQYCFADLYAIVRDLNNGVSVNVSYFDQISSELLR